MNLTIATFNLENLFTRYATIDDLAVPNNPRVVMTGVTSINYQNSPLSVATTVNQRNNTARAVLDCLPDILAVQEVENLWTLRLFNDQFLSGYFGQLFLIEGNDGRGIDVGLCIKRGLAATLVGLRTHVEELDPNRKNKSGTAVQRYYNEATSELTVNNALFSRDCLEVDIDVGTNTVTKLTFLVNHFKSQSDASSADDKLRAAQAAKVAEYVRVAQARGRSPVVLGDLNEDFAKKPSNLQALQDLIANNSLVDPFGNETDANRWTHYYAAGNEVSRLDYVLLDPSLSVVSRSVMRKGISLKCAVAGERYPTVGYVDSEASDHCPVFRDAQSLGLVSLEVTASAQGRVVKSQSRALATPRIAVVDPARELHKWALRAPHFLRVFPPYFPSPENVLNAAFNYAPLAQLDRALASGAKGQWFDSTVAY